MGISYWMVCLSPSISNDLHVSITTPPGFLLTLRFTICRVLARRKNNNTQHTNTKTHIYIHTCTLYTHRYTFRCVYVHIHIDIHVLMNYEGHNHSWNGSVMCLCCVCCLCVSVCDVRLHLINTCLKTSHSTCTCIVTLCV